MTSQTLADRVQLVVDRWWNGSVRKAADRAGIPQQTLDRIARGESQNPRGAVLQRFAQRNNISVEWLLTGSGKGPEDADAAAASLQDEAASALPKLLETPAELRQGEGYHWSQLVALLDLPLPVRRHMWSLPIATLEAAFALVIRFPTEQECAENPQAMEAAMQRETPRIIEAFRLERLAWITLFEEWIRLDGKDAVRAALIERPDLLERRFARPLIQTGATLAPAKRKGSRAAKRGKR